MVITLIRQSCNLILGFSLCVEIQHFLVEIQHFLENRRIRFETRGLAERKESDVPCFNVRDEAFKPLQT